MNRVRQAFPCLARLVLPWSLQETFFRLLISQRPVCWFRHFLSGDPLSFAAKKGFLRPPGNFLLLRHLLMNRLYVPVVFLFLAGCLVPATVQEKKNGEEETKSEESNEGGNQPSEAYQYLKKAADRTRNSKSYKFYPEFRLSSSDREEDFHTRSKGVFRQPDRYYLKSKTPSGMRVKSYGIGGTIAHIHPETDEIVTSKELGISTVSHEIQDPFQHLNYLMKPDYPGFSCEFGERKKIDDRKCKSVRVEPGSRQIQEVMSRFQDQLKKELDPEKTSVSYLFWVDEKQDLFRRIDISIKGPEKVEEKRKEDDSAPDDNQSEEKEDWKEKVEGNGNDGSSASNEDGVTITINGTFRFESFNANSDFRIPEDVKKKITEWKKESEK